MTQFNSNQLNASDELIISKYLTKYATDNSMTFTLTNETVVEAYLNEAEKFLELFPEDTKISNFIKVVSNARNNTSETL